jgi:uncharacterized protein (TIGR02145 family)
MKRMLVLLSFITSFGLIFAQDTGSFQDNRDGQTYKYITIGKQTWMAQNMNYLMDGASWSYDNDESNREKFGLLYNYEAALEACPNGWHLPTHEEWNQLISELGGFKVAGKKMKAASEWKIPVQELPELSGFNALPAGVRDYKNGTFGGLGSNTFFWSISLHQNEVTVRIRNMYHNTDNVLAMKLAKTNGFSVRCVKDKEE